MHEPGTLLFAELADAEINDGDCGHDRAEKSIFRDKEITAEVIIQGKIYAEKNEHGKNDYAQCEVYRYIALVYTDLFLFGHMIFSRLLRPNNLSITAFDHLYIWE
jgi:hypothetical protein